MSCLNNNWTSELSARSDSMNRTPTPLEPLSVFMMIGYSVSNSLTACSMISSFGNSTVFGCVNPYSCSLK